MLQAAVAAATTKTVMSFLTKASSSLISGPRYNLRHRISAAAFSTESLVPQHDEKKKEFFIVIGSGS